MPFEPNTNERLQDFLGLLAHYGPRLIAAIASGGIIGIENQIYGKSAGLRTCIVVAISCCIITIVSIETASMYNGSPDRISAQIVTGIGFLGAGVILRRGNKVAGITTASTIFLTAGLGITAGSGFVVTAIAVSLLSLLLLILLKPIDRFIDNTPFFIALRARDARHQTAKKRLRHVVKVSQTGRTDSGNEL